MKYKYKTFFSHTDIVGVGTIEAKSKRNAADILFGIYGSWSDEDGKSHEINSVPVRVEINGESY